MKYLYLNILVLEKYYFVVDVKAKYTIQKSSNLSNSTNCKYLNIARVCHANYNDFTAKWSLNYLVPIVSSLNLNIKIFSRKKSCCSRLEDIGSAKQTSYLNNWINVEE